MDAQAIIETVRSGKVPYQWTVWPLRRARVLKGAAGWGALGLVGLLLFFGAAFSTIPSNFQQSSTEADITLVGLLVLAILGFGAMGVTVFDLWRVAHAADYLIIMTPDDFVKVTPRRIIHVPMDCIAFVTLRGIKTTQDRLAEDQRVLNPAGRIAQTLGMGNFHRSPRQPPSLAFVDTRDRSEVVVATDNSFEDLSVLEQLLSQLVFAKSRRRSG